MKVWIGTPKLTSSVTGDMIDAFIDPKYIKYLQPNDWLGVFWDENRPELANLLENNKFAIKDVIFSNPATIVFWDDGVKTVVKAQNGEKYDKEKGLLACIVKRITGNTGAYNEILKQWIKED